MHILCHDVMCRSLSPNLQCLHAINVIFLAMPLSIKVLNTLKINRTKKVSECDREIPQSQNAAKPTAPLGKATEH